VNGCGNPRLASCGLYGGTGASNRASEEQGGGDSTGRAAFEAWRRLTTAIVGGAAGLALLEAVLVGSGPLHEREADPDQDETGRQHRGRPRSGAWQRLFGAAGQGERRRVFTDDAVHQDNRDVVAVRQGGGDLEWRARDVALGVREDLDRVGDEVF
jgi:hypothetical protein